jgi:carboxylesterase type B
MIPDAIGWLYLNDTVAVELDAAYPKSDFKAASYWDRDTRRLSRMIRDKTFMCPTRRVIKNWESKAHQKVWTYVFSEPLGLADKIVKLGTFHASELPFLFQTYYWVPKLAPFLDSDKVHRAAVALQCYWSNFVWNGDPSIVIPECQNETTNYDFPEWPAFAASRTGYEDASSYLSLTDAPQMKPLAGSTTFAYPDDETPGSNRCDIFDANSVVFHNLK